MPGRLDTHVLTITIQYCGGWGYSPYSRSLRQYLQQEFGSLIDIQEKKDRGITGNFEVVIMNTDTLIHSKRSGRVGKATTAEERVVIVQQIRQALEEK